MNREFKNIVIFFLVSLIIFLSPSICFSNIEISEDILSISFPDKLIFDYNFSDNIYLFSLDMKNLKNETIENISVTLDSNDFVDNVLSIRSGSLSSNESKSVKITSIFNNFIEDWKGNGELNISVVVNYYYLNSYHNISFKIPIIYGDSESSEGSHSNSNNISVVVESNKNIDNLFSKKQPIKKYNSPSEISFSRSMIDKKIIVDEILRKKMLNTIIKKPDSVSLYGRVLSIKGTPIDGVKISHKFIDKKSTSNAEGYYTLSLFKGDLNIIYECDGYWPQEIKLNIQENKSYNLKTTYLIPRLSTPSMLAFDASGRPWHLPNKKGKFSGTLLDAIVSFRKGGHLPSINTSDPYFIFIPSEVDYKENSFNIQNLDLGLYRIHSPDIAITKNIFGNKQVKMINEYKAAERIKLRCDQIQNGKAYKFKAFDKINSGFFAMSNVLGLRNPLFISAIDNPLIYPFKTLDYSLPRLVQDNRDRYGIFVDYEIQDNWIDSETITANITVSNMSGGWYLVDLIDEPFISKKISNNLSPVRLSNNLALPFLLEPTLDENKCSKVTIHNVKFSRDKFIRFHASRNDTTIHIIYIVDMMCRGLFNHPLEITDLTLLELIIDIIGENMNNIDEFGRNFMKAVMDKDYDLIVKFFTEISRTFLSERFKDVLKSGFIKDHYGIAAEKTLSELGKSSTFILDLLSVKERIPLIVELSHGTLSTPWDAHSMIYSK